MEFFVRQDGILQKIPLMKQSVKSDHGYHDVTLITNGAKMTIGRLSIRQTVATIFHHWPKILIAVICASYSAQAHAQAKYGNWTVAFVQGILEFTVVNGPGNYFRIACNSGSSMVEGSSVDINIFNKGPVPDQAANVIIDGDVIPLYADKLGTINTNYRIGAENFGVLLKRIKTSKVILVQMNDGRSASFNTAGAAQAFKGVKCSDGFYN